MNRAFATILAVAGVGAGAVANAASCNYEVNEIDLFTKEKLVSTEWHAMTSVVSSAFKIAVNERTSLFVAGVSEGDNRFVAVRLRLSNGIAGTPTNAELRDALVVTGGSSLTITLADKSEIVLHARKDVRATTRHGYPGTQSVVESIIVVHYAVGDDEFDALIDQDASSVSMSATGGRFRFVDSNGQINFKLNRKGRDKFSEALVCLTKA
jgi:hypothetical protein